MAGITPADCRAGIKALLLTIPDIGQVHEQRRQLKTENEVWALLGSDISGDREIRGWMISPARSNTVLAERHPGHRGIGIQNTQSNDIATLQWQIEGFLSVRDQVDSEQEMNDLAFDIVDIFNSYGVIPQVPTAHMQIPTNMEEFSYILLAGQFLCHYVRINTGFIGRFRP